MTTQHIGAAGELLVQYQLLKLDIDSARLTTDSGIDLVVYSPISGKASTVQVKSVRMPGPSGGRGRAAVGWNFLEDTTAELLALVLLSTDTVWLLTLDDARLLAQQHTTNGMRKIYWYTDETIRRRNGAPRIQSEMDMHRLEVRAPALFLHADTALEAGLGSNSARTS